MSTQSEAATAPHAAGRPAGRTLLRVALKLDAAVSGANGAAYVVAAGPLGGLLGLSPSLLRAAGVFLVVFAALVWLAGSRRAVSRSAVIAIVSLNALWAIASVAAAIVGWDSPEAVGTVWIVVQALVVGGFAELQLVGLRRTRS